MSIKRPWSIIARDLAIMTGTLWLVAFVIGEVM